MFLLVPVTSYNCHVEFDCLLLLLCHAQVNMAAEAEMAWKQSLKDVGLPEPLIEKLVTAGYDGEESFLSSVPDESTCGTVLVLVKADGITAETAAIHPLAGKLRLLHRKLAKAAVPQVAPVETKKESGEKCKGLF